MKSKMVIATLCCCTFRLFLLSQTAASLDVNNISATFNSSGDLYSIPPNFTNSIQAPMNNPATLFSVGQLWIGGFDQTGQLHVAGQTYRQTGTDFWPGPLDTTTATITASVSTQWDKVWEISKSTIDSFQLGLFSQIPNSILHWPANGNSSYGQAQILAPFADLNSNGVYEPSLGEYPIIRGDEAIYFIYNDNLQNTAHSETGGLPLGVEIHGMAYAFNCSGDSALANTVFLHYTIINRSSSIYTNCYVAHWLDLDLSFFDLIGTDSISNMCYFYHTGFDALGFSFLNHPMTNTMGYSPAVISSASMAVQVYNHMQSFFPDSSHLTYGGTGYGGTQVVNQCYTGNPSTSAGWVDPGSTMFTDRRTIGSYGGFVLQPGVPFYLDIALIHARDYSGTVQFQSTEILKNRAAQIQNYYWSDTAFCGGITLIHDTATTTSRVELFPNPNNGDFIVTGDFPAGSKFEVYNMLGQIVCDPIPLIPENSRGSVHIDVDGGVYFYQITFNRNTLDAGKLLITE